MTLARELADTAGRPQVDKNLLINGGMNVWQRSTSVTGITSGGYKTVDRWDLDIVNSFGTGAGTWTMAQSTDVPANQGFAYSTKIDMTATGDQVGGGTNLNLVKLDQYIEGQNVQHLLKGTSDAKALTLSFWVKSTKASNFVVTFTDPTNSRKISKGYTIDTANTWEKKTILVPGDTTGTIDNDNTSGFTVEFWLFAGLGYITGTLATSWGSHANADLAGGMLGSLTSTSDDWSITGVQLEIGEAATDFQFEPYQTTLNKCYRYCEKVDVRVIHVSRPNGAGSGGGYTNVYFKQSKRDTPTTTITTGVVNVNRPDFVRITDGVTISANQISQFPNTDEYVIADAEL
jgi:hypothetical protein